MSTTPLELFVVAVSGEKSAEICTLGEGRFGCESVPMQVDQEKAGISGAYDGVDELERKFSPSLTK